MIDRVPLRVVLEEFLLKVQVKDPKDAEDHSGALIALGALLSEDKSATVQVFLMNDLVPGLPNQRRRKRLPSWT